MAVDVLQAKIRKLKNPKVGEESGVGTQNGEERRNLFP